MGLRPLPRGPEHVFVGRGQEPCAILIGARGPNKGVHYPVNGAAARYGASVTSPTSSPGEAYADWSSEFTPARLDWPPG